MTVATAAPRRAVIDLGADATILDAARQVASTESSDIVLVVPAGAPLARNAVFLEVLRRRAGDRRIVLVSSDSRARSLASSVHMRAFSSVAALDRHEMDATEHLTAARRSALATVAASARPRRRISLVRALAVFMSLLTAAGILLAVIAPSATIVIAATTSPLGPYEYDLRAGPGGDFQAQTLIDDKVTAKATGTATDSRSAEIKATGFERFRNLTTNDIRIQRGTIVTTPDNPPIRFQTLEDKVLPRSTILPLAIGEVTVAIEAMEVGPGGNVAAGRITQDSSNDYMVTNPQATAGGLARKIPVVSLADYELAVARSDQDPEVKRAIDARLAAWKNEAAKDTTVYGFIWKRTGASPPSDVVGREIESENPTFQITVTGTVTAYRVANAEPKRTAIDKLERELDPRMGLDVSSAVVEPVTGPAVAEDGVHWRVRARGQQYPEANVDQMRAALAGRGLEEVKPLAERSGFVLQSVSPWPSWWPRLPVLDSRITIRVATPASAGSP